MKIDLIKVPLFYGCDRPGVEEGPQKLVDHQILEIFKNEGIDVQDKGFVEIPQVSEENKYKSHDHMKYLAEVIQSNENLAKAVEDSLRDGRFPFTVGGDHSLGLGSLAGTTKANGNDMAVIWVDAHADINTPETSPSGNIHGMPLGASFGEGAQELKDLYYKGQKVDPRNCFILCARSVDDGEVEMIDRLGINVWYMEEMREAGMEKTLAQLKDLLAKRNIKDIHLSFDIDSLDSAIVPGTGTPVAGGMTIEEGSELLTGIIETGLIRSMDFVEFNPKRDTEDEITLDSCLKMLKIMAKSLAKQ